MPIHHVVWKRPFETTSSGERIVNRVEFSDSFQNSSRLVPNVKRAISAFASVRISYMSERPRAKRLPFPMNLQNKPNDPLILSGRDVTAVLGPTNTGKTHLAIERMVAHGSGVIGLPLRLLAREVYQRVGRQGRPPERGAGDRRGEDRAGRRPLFGLHGRGDAARDHAAFVAIDEVQLAGDLERGHVFTDRILHLRGRQETLLLGAATMRGILERLLQGVSVVTRPRLSHLAYAGQKKLTRLPRRTAIVAFSADEVYAIAELIRRQRGGAAVVLGALSARARATAQVALYQSGDVDYLVATDAIGMGLNLDVDHVAFAQNRKFDGYQYRRSRRGRARPDRRARRPPPARRHVRRHRPGRSVRRRAGAEDRGARFRPGEACCSGGPPASTYAKPRCAEALDRDAGAGRGPDAGAAGGRRAGARAARRAIPRSASWPTGRSASRCSGRPARCPTTDASLPPSIPTSSPRCISTSPSAAMSTRPTWPSRCGAPTAPTATSTRCRIASRRSAPGPSCPTGPAGLPIRHTGRKKRARSKTDCRTRCMSG